MTNYKNSKIYKIVCDTSGKVYYGSTIQKLNIRLRKHKSNKDCTSIEIIKNNNYRIELVEEYPCETYQELLWRERHYIENNECVNVIFPIHTKEEKHQKKLESGRRYKLNNREKIKQYNFDNKEKNKIRSRKYHQNNIEKIKQVQRQYYTENKEKISINNRQYALNNKEIKKEYAKQHYKFKSSWGGDYQRHNNLLKIDPNLFN
jgi:hypothetical protein